MMKIFAVLDVKSSSFGQPFAETSTIQALRGFEAAVNKAESTLNRYPDDFCLMELANFDQQSGELVVLASPQNLGSGRSVLKKQPSQMELAQ